MCLAIARSLLVLADDTEKERGREREREKKIKLIFHP